MNERNMKLAMRRMGMTTEEMKDVEEVVIRKSSEEIIIEYPQVTVVTVQGMKTYQIVGESKSRPKGTASAAGAQPKAPTGPPEEDISLVMSQAEVERDEAVRALKESNGEPAEAILKIMARRSKKS